MVYEEMNRHQKKTYNFISKKFKDLIQPMDYKLIPLTKGEFAKVDNEDFDNVKDINWHFTYYGYAKTSAFYMHRLILDCNQSDYVDHINHDKLDNRKSNLRICSKHQNNMNTKSKKGTSIYKGVSWAKDRNKWKSTIVMNGKQTLIGSFENELEAAKAYDVKAKELFGEFAHLNFT